MLSKIFLTIAIFLTACSSTRLPKNTSEYAKTSAMITLDTRRSGGSGVILKSMPNKSWILTNKHVCNLIQVGGSVHTDQGSYPVHSFRVYKRHDLCLIEVLADLHEDTRIAEEPPSVYSEVTIAGHPALLPTIITKGHFANHMQIQLMVDTQPCDGSEKDQEALMCMMMGAKPVIQVFEAQPVTATIMAGSSGSGVFNDKGEVAGLVFAGSEGLSYGFIVPYEYVKDFIQHLSSYPEQFPDSTKPPTNFFKSFFVFQTACGKNPQSCKGIALQGIYNAN